MQENKLAVDPLRNSLSIIVHSKLTRRHQEIFYLKNNQVLNYQEPCKQH